MSTSCHINSCGQNLYWQEYEVNFLMDSKKHLLIYVYDVWALSTLPSQVSKIIYNDTMKIVSAPNLQGISDNNLAA